MDLRLYLWEAMPSLDVFVDFCFQTLLTRLLLCVTAMASGTSAMIHLCAKVSTSHRHRKTEQTMGAQMLCLCDPTHYVMKAYTRGSNKSLYFSGSFLSCSLTVGDFRLLFLYMAYLLDSDFFCTLKCSTAFCQLLKPCMKTVVFLFPGNVRMPLVGTTQKKQSTLYLSSHTCIQRNSLYHYQLIQRCFFLQACCRAKFSLGTEVLPG